MSEMAAIASINKKFFNSILFKNLGQFTDFFDVEIWIEGSKLLAHRLVLAHGSSVFHKMLKDVDHTKRPPILVFSDIKSKHMKSIIEYLYNGETEVLATELSEFFRIAKKFKIIGLYNEEPEPEPDEHSLNDSNESYRSRNSLAASTMKCTVIYNLTDTTEIDRGSNDGSLDESSQRLDASPFSQRSSKRARSNSPAKDTNGMPPRSPTTNGNGQDDVQNTQNESRQSTDGSADSTQKENRCDAIGCRKVFQTPELLQRHKKDKCGKNKQFKCRFCDKTFYLNFAQTKHEREHHKGAIVSQSQP